MKQFLLISTMLLTFSTLASHSQEITIGFQYDAAGNRTNRDTIIISEGGKGNGGPDNSIFKKEEQGTQPFYSDQIAESIIKIYPNPAESEIKIEIHGFEDSPNSLISIYDQLGKLVLSQKNITTINVINISSLKSGIYYLLIKLKTGTKEWTIIKK